MTHTMTLLLLGQGPVFMMMLPTLYYLFKYRTHAKSAMYLMLACSALATTVAAIFDTVTLLDRSNRFRLLSFFGILAIITGKFTYAVAGILRTRAVFAQSKLWPLFVYTIGTLYLGSLVTACTFMVKFHLSETKYNSTATLDHLWKATASILVAENVATCIYDCVLNTSFLWPIFQTLRMDASDAFRILISHKDMQLTIIATAAGIASAILVPTTPPGSTFVPAVLILALCLQHVTFLRLSYGTIKLIFRDSQARTLLMPLHSSQDVSIVPSQ